MLHIELLHRILDVRIDGCGLAAIFICNIGSVPPWPASEAEPLAISVLPDPGYRDLNFVISARCSGSEIPWIRGIFRNLNRHCVGHGSRRRHCLL